MKCKTKTPNDSEKIIHGKSDRLTALCNKCGTKKTVFVKKSQKGGNAQIASEAYRKPSERKKEVDGYVLDEDNNRRDTAIYRNPDTGKVFVANRGTDPTKKKKAISDLAEDGLIALGLSNTKLSKRNQKSKKITKQAVKKYGKENVTTTGHSLGGRVSTNVAERLGTKAVVYNPGSSPLDVPVNLLKKKNKNITVHSTGSDFISAPAYYSQKTKKVKQKRKKGNTPHTLDNFL